LAKIKRVVSERFHSLLLSLDCIIKARLAKHVDLVFVVSEFDLPLVKEMVLSAVLVALIVQNFTFDFVF
jgi:hypothetical protein